VSSRLPVTAIVETTRPSRITVSLRIRRRRVGTTTVERPAGRWQIPVRGGHVGALNVVSVLAVTSDQLAQVATDRIGVVPGNKLPKAVAERVAIVGGYSVTCRRFSVRRVDCGAFSAGVCQGITAYRLRPDGILTGRDYSEGDYRCRFKPKPHWPRGPCGVQLPAG
jgi:hypothetical protein